jgi:hypothetical protein
MIRKNMDNTYYKIHEQNKKTNCTATLHSLIYTSVKNRQNEKQMSVRMQ